MPSKARAPWSKATTREGLLADALEEHVYKVIAELFGKDEGYCHGRRRRMHIGDFATGHLGANANRRREVPIATGAAMALPLRGSDKVVCCFAGDGAYARRRPRVAHWAAQEQWTTTLRGPSGRPAVIYLIVNNHYGIDHRTDEE